MLHTGDKYEIRARFERKEAVATAFRTLRRWIKHQSGLRL